MKWCIIIGICICFQSTARGQVPAPTWDEVFKQKKTQRKYLVQQVAGLQIYIKALRDGYDIARKGIATVNAIKNGEFSLHDIFYLSLKLVNPRIRSYPNLLATINNLSFIQRKADALVKTINGSEEWDVGKRKYIRDCVERLNQDMDNVLSDLVEVISDRSFEMTDDARIQRIDQLFTYSRERVIFIKSFSGLVLATAAQKKSDRNELILLKRQYGR